MIRIAADRAKRALAAVVVLALSSCASVKTDVDPAADFSKIETYAWAPDSGTPEAPPDDAADAAAVKDRVRQAVDRELAARGLRPAPESDAHVWIRATTNVESRVRQNDPYYSIHLAEKYEVGTLRLALVDPKTGRDVWSGRTSRRLRDVAKTIGAYGPKFVPTSEPRVWPLEDMVRSILDRYPPPRA